MEQDVDNTYRPVCTTCLSTDRNLFLINGVGSIYQIFRLLMYDFAVERLGDTLAEMEQLICWECLALMKRFARFKQQVQSAQEHLRVLALSRTQESMDHTYMSQSLSSLEMSAKVDYDKIFFDYTTQEWPQPYIAVTHSVKNEQYDVAQAVRENINLDMDDHLLEVPEMVLENPVTGVMSHVVVGTDAFVTQNDAYTHVKGELPELTVTESQLSQDGTITQTLEPVLLMPKPHKKEEPKPAYLTEYMSEADMMATREEAKLKIQYASSVYKCELCIIGFYTQQQVEEHFVTAHRAKPGLSACKVCYTYVAESALETHVASHYWRYTCKMCRHTECSAALMGLHVAGHLLRPVPSNVLQVVASPAKRGGAGRKKKLKREAVSTPPKPGDLRKLLSKTTIEGYQCLECDMFFKNSRARKNHVARYHREGLQCDHCKKRFVNRTTLATHLRLHEGPLPREECPICHKMVRSIQIKYHIRRHQNKSRYECTDCNKLFSHLATYQAHLKYSRAHASDYVFKFPCPMCNKGYPTKEQMQDHFNYQHLGKTSHKCPVCDKPIASRANVDKHMLRVHGEKKEKPRNHTCQVCGKSFTDKKALTQHAVIHSGDRPLSCEVCQQTFKQKASLYTHRKRVHKLFPSKRLVEFMDSKPDNAG